MRRIQSTPQDPDVEESRAELERLEGHKNSAHAEIATIVENRKRIEAEAEEQKGLLQAQIQAKREELVHFEKEHHNRMHSIAVELGKAIIERDAKNNEIEIASKKLEAIQKDIVEHDSKKKPLDASIVSLSSSEERLKKSIAHLAPEVRILENKKSKLLADLSFIEGKIGALHTTHAEVSARHSEENKLHEVLSEAIPRKKEDVSKLNAIHIDLERKIAGARSEIVILEEKKVSLNKEMIDREAKANESMGNATRLELHVDAKLNQLKELEKGFTVEHLARGGYKKIGT